MIVSVIAGLTDTQERYLESIYRLCVEHGEARLGAIASDLGVAAPSARGVVQSLAEHGLVEYPRYGQITLTPAGSEAGRSLVLRHRAALDFLQNVLGVSAELAELAAADMEHDLPGPVLCRLVQFVEHYHSSVTSKYRFNTNCASLCDRRYTVDCLKPQV